MPRLLFLHGFASDSNVWQGYENIGQSVFHNIIFDENNNPLLPEISSPTIIIGWSMGAMVGLELFKSYPEFVKGLLICSSAPTFVSSYMFPAGKTIEKVLELRSAIEKGDMRAIQNFQRQLFSQKEIREGKIDRFRREIGGKMRLNQETMLHSLAFLEKYNPGTMPETEIPVKVIHGVDDIIVDKSAVIAWKKLFLSAEIIMMEAGHAIPFVQRDMIIEIIKGMLATYEQ